jgi:hypothetical protein
LKGSADNKLLGDVRTNLTAIADKAGEGTREPSTELTLGRLRKSEPAGRRRVGSLRTQNMGPVGADLSPVSLKCQAVGVGGCNQCELAPRARPARLPKPRLSAEAYFLMEHR